MPKRFGASILAPFRMFAIERINPINRNSSAPPRGRVGIRLKEKGRHWRPREIKNPRNYLAKSPGIARLVAYQFVTTCSNCAKQFGVVWVMDLTRRVDPKTVARITCPLCGTRFHQDAKDLLETGSRIQDLVLGHPVRSVEVDYDCRYCRNRGILVSLLHTDLSWGELSKENVKTAVCRNSLCPQKGLLQNLMPSRVVLGSLNPV